MVDAHSKFVEQVFALGGSLAGGQALAPPSTATTIKGGGTVTDCPAPAPGGGVEVRPVVDPTTNPF